MARTSTRIKNNKVDPATRIAREIDMPAAQITRGDIVLTDVVNFTDADQRHMTRQGKRQTIRKLTKIEKLQRAGIISAKEALACEWYHEAHSARYDVVCKVAISPGLLPLFEKVVLLGRPMGKLAITFRTAARQLLSHIEGKVAL